MPRFFLSYRQSDKQGNIAAHMLFRELRHRYGEDSVFLDVDSSRPGLSFPKKLELELKRTDAVLVIIGGDWLGRLQEKREDERDWVRYEISESLKRENLPVVPICVDGVSLPAPSQLPPEIRELAYRDGVPLDLGRDFDSHLNRFLINLEKVIESVAGTKVLGSTRSTPEADPVKPGISGIFRDTLKDGTPGPEMVSLPGGSFLMGSPDTEAKHRDSEGPQHRVSLQPFAISRTAVSFADYDRFVAATRRKLPNDAGWGRGDRPVVHVSWYDAKAYAEWLSDQAGKNYRLPTEAEWEYAARAGTTTAFWTGNCINTDQANYDGNYDYAKCGAKTGKYRQKTVPVGSLPANPWGLYEMAGNVWEWTEDCWHDNYLNAPTDGSAWLNTAGGNCARRVVRGGSWFDFPQSLRSAVRFGFPAGGAIRDVGIRLARTP